MAIENEEAYEENLGEEVYEDEYEEEYGEEYADPEVENQEDEDEDTLIPIALDDDEVIDVPYSEIVAAYKLSKEAPTKFEQYEKAISRLQIYEGDELFQAIAGYKAQGYKDDQIIYGLNVLREQQMGKSKAEEEDREPTIEEIIAEEVEKRLKPYKEESERAKMEREIRQQETLKAQNDQLFFGSLEEYGWNPNDITAKELKAIRNEFSELYPGVEATKVKLTKAQTDRVIRLALGKKEQTESKPSQQRLAKQVNAPKVLGSKVPITKKQGVKVEQQNLTREDRLRNIKNFLND